MEDTMSIEVFGDVGIGVVENTDPESEEYESGYAGPEGDSGVDGASLEEIMAYRVEPVAKTGRPRPWYVYDSKNPSAESDAVAQRFNMNYNTLKALRASQEWKDTAKAFVETHPEVDIKHLTDVRERSVHGDKLTNANIKKLGEELLDILVSRSKIDEVEGLRYVTTPEWAFKQLAKVKKTLVSMEWNADPRAVKKSHKMSDKIENAKQIARNKGLSEEEVAEIFHF